MTHRSLSAFLALAGGICIGASTAGAAVAEFKTSGGGEWTTAENWQPATVPTASDTAYFGYRMGKADATITLAEDAAAKNINGDSDGPANLTIDLNGSTLELGNQSDIKLPITLKNGVVTSKNQFAIHQGGVLTLGEDATLQATGGSNQVEVKEGGTLIIDGGRLEEATGKRDLAAASGATVHFAGAGSIAARSAELQDGSTLHFTLPAEAYEEAPLQLHENINNLGALKIDTAEGYTHTPGAEYPLISYPRGTVEDKFTGLDEGSTVVTDAGHRFELTYEGANAVTLTAVE